MFSNFIQSCYAALKKMISPKITLSGDSSEIKPVAQLKSLKVTYLLWLFGGWFGLHHLYLGRDRHALVWFLFAGGYFGLGWLRDLWRIPEYVKDANEDKDYIEKLKLKIYKNPKPPSSTVRCCGQIIVADAFGYLVIAAIPTELVPDCYLPYFAVMVPFAAAVGVHLVGNIGHEEGTFWQPLLGAYFTYPLYFWSMNSVFWTSLVSSCCFNWYAKKWRQKRQKQSSLCYRLLTLSLCCGIYFTLWGVWLTTNCTITNDGGDEVKCMTAVSNFFKSPMWKEFISVMQEIYQYAHHHGWREVFNQIFQAFDPYGEHNALKVLNLSSTATQDEIKVQYRKLSRQWHPDRHKEKDQKDEAAQKFMEIQQAYEVLSKIKLQRISKNKMSDEL